MPLFFTGPPWLGAAAFVVGVVANSRISRRVVRYKCSTCQGFVCLDDQRCWLCGGSVAGALARAEDRLELPSPREHDADGHGLR